MKTDVRDAFEGADNPVVLGALKFRVAGSLDEMGEMLVGEWNDNNKM